MTKAREYGLRYTIRVERGRFVPPVEDDQGLTDHLALVSVLHQPDGLDVRIVTHGEQHWPKAFWIGIVDFALGEIAKGGLQ